MRTCVDLIAAYNESLNSAQIDQHSTAKHLSRFVIDRRLAEIVSPTVQSLIVLSADALRLIWVSKRKRISRKKELVRMMCMSLYKTNRDISSYNRYSTLQTTTTEVAAIGQFVVPLLLLRRTVLPRELVITDNKPNSTDLLYVAFSVVVILLTRISVRHHDHDHHDHSAAETEIHFRSFVYCGISGTGELGRSWHW